MSPSLPCWGQTGTKEIPTKTNKQIQQTMRAPSLLREGADGSQGGEDTFSHEVHIYGLEVRRREVLSELLPQVKE